MVILTDEQHADLRELLTALMNLQIVHGIGDAEAGRALDVLDAAARDLMLLAMPDPDAAIRH